MYSLGIKTWLLREGRFLLSEGRAELLRLIETERSLLKASEKMGMSYRHAWGAVRKIEKALGSKVVKSARGGKEGGKTTLTRAGRELLHEWDRRNAMLERFEGSRMPRLAVDGIIILNGKLVTVQRVFEPYKGKFVLPGGFLEYGETAEEGVVREVFEETGLRTRVARLVGVYSEPDRDPRGHVVSAVFELHVLGGRLRPSSETKSIRLIEPRKGLPLAFDHSRIVCDFLGMRPASARKQA